jgi:asparagine synthase (glutamine-hydrolysing)
MSGIAGVFCLSENCRIESSSIKNMLELLHPTGPHGNGIISLQMDNKIQFLADENTSPFLKGNYSKDDFTNISHHNPNQCNGLFGYCHLNIGEGTFTNFQPYYDKENQLIVMLDGEIYNHGELVKNYAASQQERLRYNENLISFLFDRLGTKMFCLLNGKFGLFIYDIRKRKAYLARDRGGIRHIFYSVQNNRLVFASNIRAILRSGYYNKKIDFEGLWNNISFPAPPQPLTVFKDIRAVERGSYISFSVEKPIEKEFFWSFPIGQKTKHKNLVDTSAELRHLLEKAIESQSSHDSHVATLISGGVDSPLISAIATKFSLGIKAFTIGMADPKYGNTNEHEKASLTARMYDMNHIVKLLTFDDYIKHLDKIIELMEQPGATISPYFMSLKVVKDYDVNQLLNGLSADELHGGFPYFSYIAKWRKLFLFRHLAYFIPRGRSKKWENIKNMFKAGNSISEYYTQSFSTIKEWEKLKLFPGITGYNSVKTIQSIYNFDESLFADDIERMMYFMFSNAPNHHLYRFDQYSKYFGIESRYPFLDNDVIDFSLSIPSNQKVKGFTRKIALKEAARGIIADASLVKQTQGFSTPIGGWIKNELAGFARMKIDQLKNRAFVDADEIEKYYQTYKDLMAMKVWKLVMIELWLEKFIDNNFWEHEIVY